MARKGTRAKIARNIYRDDIGHEIEFMINGETVSRRFPLDMSRVDLEIERDAMRAKHGKATQRERQAGRTRKAAGTIKIDADRFFQAWRGRLQSPDAMRQHLDAWVRALGEDTPRRSITAEVIGNAMTAFATEAQPSIGRPYSIEQRRKLLRLVRQWWAYLDGEDAPNPGRGNLMPTAPKPEARGLDIAEAQRVLDSMTATATRARLRLILCFGITHAEIKRLKRADIDWKRGRLTITARRKGGGTMPRALPFGNRPLCVEALREFEAYNAFGVQFSNAAMDTTFKRALTRLGMDGLGWRVYDLRHTCASELFRETGDLGTVQKWLGHSNIATTQRYVIAAEDDRLLAAERAMAAADARRKSEAQRTEHPQAA